MSATLKQDERGLWQIELQNEPDYCQALTMRPVKIEPALLHGVWLVYLVAVWSAPDILAMQEVLDTIKLFEGKVRLGIRPFDQHEEISRWLNGVSERWGSPLWLFLRDGQLLKEKVGLLKPQELLELIQELI